MFIPKWNELKSSAKVVKYFDVCNSMCLFLRKSSRIGSKKTQAICEECGRGKRHKPYVRSAGGGKDTSQGEDMYKKTQAICEECRRGKDTSQGEDMYKKTQAGEGNRMKRHKPVRETG